MTLVSDLQDKAFFICFVASKIKYIYFQTSSWSRLFVILFPSYPVFVTIFTIRIRLPSSQTLPNSFMILLSWSIVKTEMEVGSIFGYIRISINYTVEDLLRKWIWGLIRFNSKPMQVKSDRTWFRFCQTSQWMSQSFVIFHSSKLPNHWCGTRFNFF